MNALRTLGPAAVTVALFTGCGLLSGEPTATTSVAAPSAPPTSVAGPPQTTAAVPAPTTAPATSTEMTPTPTQTPVVYSTAATSHQPTAAVWEYQLGDVRVGSHEEYDRVVIEVSGSESAGLTWWAEYSAEPRTQGRGDIVDLPGDAVIAVRLQGIGYPPPDAPVLQGVLDNSAHGNITGVYVDPMFEAMSQIFIGLDQQRGFHVTTLESPSRLVIDIER